MRIAILQFAPKLGLFEENVKHADSLLSKVEEQGKLANIDILALPEMAFSGYNFSNKEHIRPHLELTGSGPTSEWARKTAARLNCYVAVGYPELDTSSTSRTGSESEPNSEPKSQSDSNPEPKAYNSLLLISPSGTPILNYHKSHLYYTDNTWATEGPGFPSGKTSISLPLPLPPTSTSPSQPNPKPSKTLTAGICMDINPYNFTAPWTRYEFATHAKASGADIILLSMAWLSTLSLPDIEFLRGEPDMDTFGYWMERFEPLILGNKRIQTDDKPDNGDDDNNDEIEKGSTESRILIFANRTGVEPGLDPLTKEESEHAARYAGTSCVLSIQQGSGEIRCFGMIGRGEEGVLVVDTASEDNWVRFMMRRRDRELDPDSGSEQGGGDDS